MIGLWALSGISAETFSGISDLQSIGKMALAAGIGAVPALLALLQNSVENRSGKDFLVSKRMPDELTSPPNPQPPVVPTAEEEEGAGEQW